MHKITVVISAYNEESKIRECLQSLSFLDPILEETILIDNTSIDKTKEIAEKLKARVFTVPNNLMLNVNKNFGFTKARTEWILNLDADERLTPELAIEIKKAVGNENEKINGYWIPRKNIIFGKWIENSIWWPDFQLRLFRNGEGKFPEHHVHEYLSLQGEAEKLSEPMIHQNYSSITQYLQKMDKIYTENEVKNLISSGKTLHWTEAISMPIKDFLNTFFMLKGYKDGLHGLVLSILQAIYAELVFLKLWEHEGFQKVNSKNFLKDVYATSRKCGFEIRYWFLSSMIETSNGSVKKTYLRVLRKITSRKIEKI